MAGRRIPVPEELCAEVVQWPGSRAPARWRERRASIECGSKREWRWLGGGGWRASGGFVELDAGRLGLSRAVKLDEPAHISAGISPAAVPASVIRAASRARSMCSART